MVLRGARTATSPTTRKEGGGLLMKKLILLIAALVVAMGTLATTALADGHGEPPPLASAYCVGGQTVDAANRATVMYKGGSVTISRVLASVIFNLYPGGKFFVGTDAEFGFEVIAMEPSRLAPGWSGPHRVTVGACAVAEAPKPQHIAVCSPTVVDRPGDIPGIFLTVEYDAWADTSGPYNKMPPANFVEGVGLTCDPAPAGYVRKGTAGADQHVSAEPGYPLWVKP